jgi:pimeloyl-ACP methyl ester carboxylesterase
MTDLAMAWFKLIGIRHRPTRPAAVALSCPMLIIHGEEDIVSPPSHAEQLVEAARDAELQLVEGAAHLDVHLVDAPRHDEAIRRFVQRLLQ